MVADGIHTYHSEHFVRYINVESVCCTTTVFQKLFYPLNFVYDTNKEFCILKTLE